MPNNKSPGNDGITKNLGSILGWAENSSSSSSLSVNKAFKVRELITSQKQVVIKLIEKRKKINNLLKIGDLFLVLTLTRNWF